MLRIAEHWHGSDTGRQRQGNEDDYFVRSPLFVVADGMGGAQAGEVASGMAVEGFDGGLPDGSPAEGLVRMVEDANRRIHDRSRSDERHAGMGTTLTGAYVGESEVTIVHVGDSRAYLWRDDDLIRLTRDHSLVGELVARGKLTEEQAETHPQRSVITRALGPEPEVEVDVDVFGARAGDVFLLCSDGLTSMVPEPKLTPLLAATGSLERLGRQLIGAANEAGGRDNITVILFRLEEVDGARGGAGEPEGQTTEYDTFEGEPVTGPEDEADREAAEAEYRRQGTVAMAPVRPRPRRRRRIPGAALLAAGLLAVLVVGSWIATRAVYFVGVDADRGNAVTIYQGVPIDLPLGLSLYDAAYHSGVPLQEVPTSRREAFTEHKWRSKDDAENLVIQLERGQLES